MLIPSHPQIDDEYINDYLELFIYRSVGYGLPSFNDYEFIWIHILERVIKMIMYNVKLYNQIASVVPDNVIVLIMILISFLIY